MKGMIKIVGNDIMRGGEKIGWIEGNDLFNDEGKKVGYVADGDVFDYGGTKVAYLEGNQLHWMGHGSPIRLEENRKHVAGGSCSDEMRAAIRVLLGD